MRKIPLLTPRIETDDGSPGQLVPYADLILARVRTTTNGLTVEQIESALAVVSAVRKAKAAGADCVLLEEPSWAYLAEKVSEGGWALVDPLIPSFVRAVRVAETVDVVEAPCAAVAE
jgi:hypothetical protein